MINQIFYYPSSLTFNEYLNMLNNGEVSGRTIVFAAAQKAIYKGGVQYGATDLSDLIEQLKAMLDDPSIIDKIEQLVKEYYKSDLIDDSYVVNKIQQLIDQYFNNHPDTLPKASKAQYGVVKVGNGIDVSNGVISVTLVKGDKGDQGEKGDKGDQGETGATGPAGPSYDDQWIQDAIDRLNTRALNEKTRILEYINDKDNDIQDLVEHIFEDYLTIIREADAYGNYQKYTFNDPNTMEWVSTLGHVTNNGDGTYDVNWSEILQTVSQIKAQVNQITANPGTGGTVNYEALSSGLYSYIENDIATSGLSSNWVRLMGGAWDSTDRTVLEWIAADVKTWANNQLAFADVMASARQYDSTGKTVLQEAAAGVNALVTKNGQGQYVATATLSALVNSTVDTKLASVLLETLDQEAMASIYAYMDQEIAGATQTALSGLESRVQSLENSGFVTTNSLSSTIGQLVGDEIETQLSSSVATKAYVDGLISGAETTILSQVDNTYARISASVTKDGNGVISNATIDADDININSSHKLTLTADNFTISSSDLVAKLGNASITADKIDINSTFINAIQSQLNVQGLSANNISVTSGGGTTTVDTDGIKTTVSGSTKNWFKQDGSGFLAGGNLSWDTSGNLTANSMNATGSFLSGTSGYVAKITSGSGVGGYVEVYNSSHGADHEAILGANSSQGGWLRLDSTDGSTSFFSLLPDTALMQTGSDYITIGTAGSNGPRIQVYSDGYYGVLSNQGASNTSDMRVKNVIEDVNIPIEDIANAPLFRFTYKNSKSNTIHIGTSAQYWLEITPEAIGEIEGTLCLNYGVVSATASILSAKEIVSLKQQNAALIQRIEALESRLQLIENKL